MSDSKRRSTRRPNERRREKRWARRKGPHDEEGNGQVGRCRKMDGDCPPEQRDLSRVGSRAAISFWSPLSYWLL